jgi:hypothetical protein
MMKKVWLLVVLALICFEGAAFAYTDADSPSIACNGYAGSYVRIAFVVTFAPVDNQEPGNETIVDAKFSSGMAGKDVVISFKDAQTLGATIVLEGFCEPNGYLNTHWAYDSGNYGAQYTITYENPLKISRIN